MPYLQTILIEAEKNEPLSYQKLLLIEHSKLFNCIQGNQIHYQVNYVRQRSGLFLAFRKIRANL